MNYQSYLNSHRRQHARMVRELTMLMVYKTDAYEEEEEDMSIMCAAVPASEPLIKEDSSSTWWCAIS